MRFNPKARLDTSQVEVRRGRGGGGGGLPFPIPSGGGGMKVGGGIGGIIVLILILVVSQCMGGGLDLPTGQVTPRSDNEPVSSTELTECRTGEDANNNPDCARLAVVNSIQGFWSEAIDGYREADTVMFSGSVSTGCGGATSAVGPFYCPPDQKVYLDTTFFKDMLEGQLGATGGDFAEAYVLAHEYGHHIQNLTGYMGKVRTQQGPESDAVRLELQADCLGGLWANHATQVPDADGNILIQGLNEQDIAEAINAAQAVGDDRIQQKSGGRINPDQWTHGSADAREYWFRLGYRNGDFKACDTFKARDLHLDG
ncbi:MAG TPA: neutral zinc metallopeptidase [Nocardioidaceae bacterium]|nr:neutral zinc metallopeptidase [Nocardioidaceae bacterium]